MSPFRGYEVELIQSRIGDCGCPEEEYLFHGAVLTIHYEPNGDVDAFMDYGSDYWEADTSLEGYTPFAGRIAVFAWAASLIVPGPEI